MATDTSTGSSEPYYSAAHELANTVTHGIGFLLTLGGVVALVIATRTSGIWLSVAAVAYGATLVLVYALSTLSHAVKEGRGKDTLRVWDQAAIYFLIVGTYTPFVARYLTAEVGSLLAAVIWISALLGFYTKAVMKHRVHALATWSYLLLGWLPAMPFIGRVPFEVFVGMALGGISYSVGIVFLKLDYHCRYLHAVWHIFVILGSAIHFYVIYAMVIPA